MHPTATATNVEWAAWLVLATTAMLLAWAVARRAHRQPPAHRWGRHVALALPLLAPERWCACGCAQRAAPGAWLADWHYDPPAGVLPPSKVPQGEGVVPVQGLAWSLGPDGWVPALVYVLAHQQQPPSPRPSTPPPHAEVASTNGRAH